MEFLLETINPAVLLGCVLIGYIVKTWTNDAVINNKLIPTILAFVGGVSYFILYGTFEKAVIGAYIGLGATGCYELVKNWIKLLSGKYGGDK